MPKISGSLMLKSDGKSVSRPMRRRLRDARDGQQCGERQRRARSTRKDEEKERDDDDVRERRVRGVRVGVLHLQS